MFVRRQIKKILRRAIKPALSKIRNVLDETEIDPRLPTFPKTIRPIPGCIGSWIPASGKRTGRLRPNYTWALLHAGYLAKTLGMRRISAIEFGVAGGNGLLALENAAELVEQKIGVKVDVYGFDTGAGLPPPLDYRDLPNLYTETAYRMDVDKLKERLKRARLILGLVEETVSEVPSL